MGCAITLHCFQYGARTPSDELAALCNKVYYYPRREGLRGLHYSLPYIVSSRRHRDLLPNLCRDQSPLLFEGIHTTALIHEPALKDRIKLLRVHNIEQDYYRALGMQATQWQRQLYYFFEAGRLKQYENQLHPITHFLSISQTELDFFSRKYPHSEHKLLTAFHAQQTVSAQKGTGTYCLYHGNLDVDENRRAVLFLVQEVFANNHMPLVIAGRNTRNFQLPHLPEYIQLRANPSHEELQTLMRQAQMHVLPSFQNTGLKLKLLNSLYEGRFCVANEAMTAGSGLENLVVKAESAAEFREQIQALMTRSFTEEDIQERIRGLAHFSNQVQAQKMVDLLP